MKRTKTKVLSFLLSISMLCGIAVPSALADNSIYNDTEGHWAEASIERWSEYGIITGDGESFNPDDAVTRAQMATILAKTLGLTEEAENPFTDVSEDSWYAAYVLRCYKAGIMLGDDGKANPDSKITRQEAMTMLCRALGIEADTNTDLTVFKDSGEIAGWALPYVSALIGSGIVSGITADTVAPLESMSRAALVTVLDRAVVQYINAGGEYTLTDKDGIVLVAAGGVTLKGETKADIVITQGADGKDVNLDEATVSGTVTVKGDNVNVIGDSTKIPTDDKADEGEKADENKGLEESPSPTKRPSIGGGSGGSYTPQITDLTISQAETKTGGTYNNVTVTAAVGNGTVELKNVTVKGNLTVNGGGKNSVKLNGCTISGKVIMAKNQSEQGAESPRLELTGTPISVIEVQNPAIIEATDDKSAVGNVTTNSNLEIKGSKTTVGTIDVSENSTGTVGVTVTGGSVSTINANSASNVTTGTDGNVSTVNANAPTTVSCANNSVDDVVAASNVTVDSNAVSQVEVSEDATSNVNVDVKGSDTIEVEVNSSSGATITTENNSSNVTVSTSGETAPNVSVDGTAATHVHKWGEPKVVPADCENDGSKTYTCIADGCADSSDPSAQAATKTEVIKALGHDWGDWAKYDKDQHVRVCKTNSEHKDYGKHNWNNGEGTTPATEENEGVKTFTCADCKETKTEPIPVIKPSGIVLSQDEDGEITMKFPAFDSNNVKITIENSEGNAVWEDYHQNKSGVAYEETIKEGVIASIAPDTGTATFSLVAYDDAMAGKTELDRLNNAIQVTAQGSALEYTIEYDTPEVAKHKVDITTSLTATAVAFIWSNNGNVGGYGVHGGSPRDVKGENTLYNELSDGDVLDIRAITNWTLDGKTVKATVTPASKKTYTDTFTGKVRWTVAGTIRWKATDNTEVDDYRINVYSGNTVNSENLVKTHDIGGSSYTSLQMHNINIAEVANYTDGVFTIEVVALDANDRVIETIGSLDGGIVFAMDGTAPVFDYEVTGEKTYTINFEEGTPTTGMRCVEWIPVGVDTTAWNYYPDEDHYYYSSHPLTQDLERDYAFKSGDVVNVYIETVNTATRTVWTYKRTPTATKTYLLPSGGEN